MLSGLCLVGDMEANPFLDELGKFMALLISGTLPPDCYDLLSQSRLIASTQGYVK